MSTHDHFAEYFGDLVGRGAQAAVYARGEVVVKVFNAGYNKANVFYEAAMMGFVEPAGIAMPRPIEVLSLAGRMCLKMTRIGGPSLDGLMIGDPSRAPALFADLVRLQREIHAKRVFLPVSQRHRLREMLRLNTSLDSDRRQALLALSDGLPDGEALCHGDFHGQNILVDNGTYKVIDWIEVTKGDPLVDASHSYTVIGISSREGAELYLECYCAASGARREEVLRWVPLQAGSLYGVVPDGFGPALLRMVDGRW